MSNQYQKQKEKWKEQGRKEIIDRFQEIVDQAESLDLGDCIVINRVLLKQKLKDYNEKR